jgi:tryptophan synthase alpha chain
VSPNPVTAGRIAARFAELARRNRAAFVAYVMAGDPDAETAFSILEGLPGAGADLIELGMPFSDPMADGPSVQRAGIRALAAGMTMEGVFAMARRFRLSDTTTPIVLMGYLNPIVSLGFETFAARAAEAGVDGLIAVDCPPEEAGPLADALDRAGIDLIRLATPTTDDARLAIVARRTRGFVYYVSVAGVTGVKSAAAHDVAPAVARVRAASGLPVAVGFGIRTPEQAASIARVADGAVVGSALVDAIAGAIADGGDPAARVLATAASLSGAISSARLLVEEPR